MPEKITERTLYPPIMKYLNELGIESVSEIDVGGIYPDILFYHNNQKFVIQVKIGEQKQLLKGIGDAFKHAQSINTNNMIVLTYPSDVRKVVSEYSEVESVALNSKVQCFVLTKDGSDFKETEVKVFLKEIKEIIDKQIAITPSLEFVITAISEGIEMVSEILRTYSEQRRKEVISQVVGKFELFLALGETEKSNKLREDLEFASIDLTSYLLINQILFYYIYRELMNKEKIGKELPELKDKIQNIEDIKNCFDSIQEINYKAIYSINVLPKLFEDIKIRESIETVIKAIKIIKPEQIKQDLLGRMFHNLLPFKTRKTLAAFYTNPIAGEILAELTIENGNEEVIDPACGSGTLLVSAYKRKMELSHGNKEDLHKKFVENDITGLDIMPFATHLTAVNLSSQTITAKTNKVRIGIRDSLEIQKYMNTENGAIITPFTKTIQRDIFGEVYNNSNNGSINAEGKKGEEFSIKKVDSVIMNPPFSDRRRLPDFYRNKLIERKALTERCGNQVNLWGFFLALANDLIKENGRIGAVIPINIFRGESTKKIRDFILKNYKIKYILKSVKDIAFTENASFRDVLLILQKSKPEDNYLTQIIFIKKSLNEINAKNIVKKIKRVQKGKEYKDEELDIYWISYKELKEKKENLMQCLWANESKSIEIFNKFFKLINKKGKNKLTKIKENEMREGFGTRPEGLSQLVFITKNISDDRTERAFLILEKEKKNSLVARMIETNFEYEIEKDKTRHALRTITGINKIDISENHDYIVFKDFKGFDTVLKLSKWKDKKKFDWNKVKSEIDKKSSHLLLLKKFNIYSPNSYLLSVYSNEKFVSSNVFTLFLFKDKEKCKFLSLFLNSTLGLIQTIILKSETTGQYIKLTESDMSLFNILDVKALTEKEKEKLNILFEKIKNIEFPSILEQLESKFWAREEIDRTILKILGLSEEEINDWLPKIYETLTKELKATKEIN